ncbi:MAG TPA: DEAD/DEAH box helicase, partial [Candidatus Scalindua sp.]|nr:DEAD/DEAH box helicase [Candidatus Scalindua sp.]
YDCVILDESVIVKNCNTVTWRSVRCMSEKANYVFFLSAEPFENNLSEIYGQVEACAPGTIGSPKYFNQRYCVWDKIMIRRGGQVIEIPKIVGYKNKEEFKRLIAPVLLYRTNEDIDRPEIPIKIMTVRIDLTSEQRKIYDRLQSESKKEKVRSTGDIFKWQGILLRAADTARFYGGKSSSKVDKVVEILRHPLIRKRGVLVYTHYYEMLEHLREAIVAAGFRVARYSGKESSEERAKIKRQLLSKEVDVVLMTAAGGKGSRLEGASVVILVERPWSGKAVKQIVGRVAREGQKEKFVIAVLIIARNTKDDYVSQVIRKKEKAADDFYDLETALKGQKINSLDELY